MKTRASVVSIADEDEVLDYNLPSGAVGKTKSQPKTSKQERNAEAFDRFLRPKGYSHGF